ncbi:MAG: hypothetical protein Q8R92_08000 [Deltaproteobacteria bacterium]|nr:hypothetical protein [Deltaproteobacteria bacterium]
MPASLFALAVTAACASCEARADGAAYVPPPVEEALGGLDRFWAQCRVPLVIRLPSDSPVVGTIRSIDFDVRWGVAIADPIEKRVFQFDTLGRPTRVFGAPGSGPGEFRDPIDAVWVSEGQLLVLDRYKGIVLFGASGTVIRDPHGPRFSGGTRLSRLDDASVLLGVLDHTASSVAPAFPHMARMVNIESGEQPLGFAPEDRRATFRIRFVRDVSLAADPTGSFIAVVVPYALGVQFYAPDGRLVDSWEGQAAAYRRPVLPPARFAGQGSFYQWARSFSHLFFVGVPDSSAALLGWETFVDDTRHYYLGLYSRESKRLVSVEEIPFRPVRSRGDTVVFLNSADEPANTVIVCRGWARQ